MAFLKNTLHMILLGNNYFIKFVYYDMNLSGQFCTWNLVHLISAMWLYIKSHFFIFFMPSSKF